MPLKPKARILLSRTAIPSLFLRSVTTKKMAIEAQLPGPEGHDVGKPSLGPIVPMNHPTKHTAPSGLSPSTRAVHADDHFVGGIADVAPPLHVSTTFHYPGRPEDLVPFSQITDLESFDAHIYSRHTAPNSARLEVVLSSLLKGRAITYASGLAAYHATLVGFVGFPHLDGDRLSFACARLLWAGLSSVFAVGWLHHWVLEEGWKCLREDPVDFLFD